ncbi:hypothetical protein EDD63_11635 [Breznakia blatticola]|uniref:Uncharacterized protein n=1 Tax=Breznakia blatticola TaxID=1754012 RepID=A0A4R7ZPT2_9FIRM|nr:hypothetical protein [Breznakia blatticola]TDW19933.1 hypothetical protein EDD63_11635 [Breznakia blatticola]
MNEKQKQTFVDGVITACGIIARRNLYTCSCDSDIKEILQGAAFTGEQWNSSNCKQEKEDILLAMNEEELSEVLKTWD